MKLIVDVPEVDYNYAKQQVADGITNPLKIFIANGTPIPDKATNGDVIRKLFSNDELIKYLKDQWTYWWNAPYQKGGKNE